MKAEHLIEQLKSKNLKLVTAESCTGGLIAATITAIPGSSAVFDRGFITYSNEAKIDLLGVSPKTLNNYGAVSKEVAEEMAIGALKNTNSDIAVSATGIAGPSGGSVEKPVGLVFIGICYQGKTRVLQNHLTGTREEIQVETVSRTFDLINSVLA
jgi:PncC family amidohydrolase